MTIIAPSSSGAISRLMRWYKLPFGCRVYGSLKGLKTRRRVCMFGVGGEVERNFACHFNIALVISIESDRRLSSWKFTILLEIGFDPFIPVSMISIKTFCGHVVCFICLHLIRGSCDENLSSALTTCSSSGNPVKLNSIALPIDIPSKTTSLESENARFTKM